MLNHLKGKKKVNKKTITLYIQKYKKIIKVKKRNHLKQALELCTVGKLWGISLCVLYRQRMQFFLFIFRCDCTDFWLHRDAFREEKAKSTTDL